MEKLPMPSHLLGIADVVEQGDTCATLRLRCPCGSSLFHMERAAYSPEEQSQMKAYEASYRAATQGYRLKYGKTGMLRKRGLFGRWEPVECLPRPACHGVTAIRAACAACGARLLVFDNRLHGFRKVCGFTMPPMDGKPLWEPIGAPDAQGCQVEITYPMERFQFESQHPGADFDNAFDRIDITSRNAHGFLKPLLSAYA